MPHVYLTHQVFSYAASDVLRLFFGKVQTIHEDGSLLAGADDKRWLVGWHEGKPFVTDLVVGSRLLEKKSLGKSDGSPFNETSAVGEEKLRIARREVKIALYDYCVIHTGKSFPWGSLTGIRPTLVAAEIWRQTGGHYDRTVSELESVYKVETKKAVLAVDTMLEEERLLAHFPLTDFGLYIGIPFCPTRCHYCSFTMPEGIGRTAGDMDRYVTALCQEMTQVLTHIRPQIRTIYIGGGTPTSLNAEQLEQLLSTLTGLIRTPVALPDGKQTATAIDYRLFEFCLEAGRPDTITEDKLVVAKAFGVNRICINPQTMH
ncbi:MAG TPA: hypothetical protein GX717_05260, partial [Clostridiaceae bacterium]|nr:hypothetical protein [Clostridiaceae bacterium]